MDEDIIVTLKKTNDLLMTFDCDYSAVFLPAIDEIERLREKCKNMVLLLKDCDEHLDYCGYGDRWEREMAYSIDLPNRLEAALKEIA